MCQQAAPVEIYVKQNKQTTTTNQPYYFAVNKQPYTSVSVSVSPTHLMGSRSPLVSLWRRLGVKQIQHGWWSVMKKKTAA